MNSCSENYDLEALESQSHFEKEKRMPRFITPSDFRGHV